tara:strand:+ start:93098 stop:96214 length:3117 start_codon:yes stop_codon:yes gene_type:complete
MILDYKSNSLTKLSDKFLELLASESSKNPFKKNWIIIQNKEMQQWITLREAEVNSISANNEFIFPSEFIWKLYRFKNPELDKYLPSDRIPLQWTVFEILSQKKDLLKKITGKESFDPKQLVQLSESISDVFDLYQVFRPGLIKKWENKDLQYNVKNENWQADLWRELSKKWSSSGERVTRVDAYEQLTEWLRNDSFLVDEVPENIWVFSLPHLSKPFSDILSLLSKHRTIHNFGYSFGKENEVTDSSYSRKLLKSHFDTNYVLEKSSESFEATIQRIDLLPEAKPNTKLSGVQKMIQGSFSSSVTTPDDDTIQIHSCHNIRREVETLKDHLLHELEKNPSLKPEECMILVPGLEEYKDVLKDELSESINDPNLPLGRGFDDNSKLIKSTLKELLALLNSDFKVNSVLDLIDNPIISKKWKFSESDLTRLREWAVELHIHRGIGDSVFSWKSAIDSLFLGYAMEGDRFELFDNKSVYSKPISSESTDLMARLSNFVNLLEDQSKLLQNDLTVSKWLNLVINITELFLDSKYTKDFGVRKLTNQLQQLTQQLEHVNTSELISCDLFLLWFNKQISKPDSGSVSFGHGINISEYVPNRNIPYKFVAILGLNEKVLTGSALRPEFDLINQFPSAGDRIEKDEQRFLFFEMINSAKETLYISYLGQNSQSTIETLPSVLLQEMVETCKQVGISINTQKHRLHGFEKEYFSTDSVKKLGFSEHRKKIAELISKNSPVNSGFISRDVKVAADQGSNLISVNELISFFSHPVKYFCREILEISNYDEFQEPDDRELFQTRELNKYFLKEFLQDAFFQNLDEKLMRTACKASGLVPEGYPGELDFNSNLSLIRQLSKVKEAFDLSNKRRLEIEFSLDPFQIQGTIDNVVTDHKLEIRLGRLKARNIINLWLNHLILNIESDYTSHLFYFDANDDLKNLTLSPEIIKEDIELKRIINWYLNSVENPKGNIFPLETSYEYARTLLESGSEEKAKKAAYSKWESWGGFSESDDYYNSLVYQNGDFIEEQSFIKSSETLWLPILKATGEIK